MGSGKSTLALQMNHTLKQKGYIPLLVKSNIDTRDIGTIKSRIGLEHVCVSFSDLKDYDSSAITHFIVDEAQFINDEEFEILCRLSDDGKHVMCFGLRTDYTGKLFYGSSLLFAQADDLIDLPIISRDGNKCVLHIRYIDGKPVFEGDSIFVGDQDIYDSVSRKEWRALKMLNKE